MATKLPALIGVIHLPALAGAPMARGEHPALSLQKAGKLALREAELLADAGFQGLILENFGDIPFYKEQVPAETVASLSVIAAAVRENVGLPLGINVLRNDGRSALAIAAVTGSQFIRVNVLSGIAATDQGMVEGKAAELLRDRERLGGGIAIFADALVKHARSLSVRDPELAVEELALRAGADAVIVSGATTGRAVNPDLLVAASRSARHCRTPLYIGSGASLESLAEIRRLIDGVIVSSALRKGGKAGAPLEPKRAKEFARAFLGARKRR